MRTVSMRFSHSCEAQTRRTTWAWPTCILPLRGCATRWEDRRAWFAPISSYSNTHLPTQRHVYFYSQVLYFACKNRASNRPVLRYLHDHEDLFRREIGRFRHVPIGEELASPVALSQRAWLLKTFALDLYAHADTPQRAQQSLVASLFSIVQAAAGENSAAHRRYVWRTVL